MSLHMERLAATSGVGRLGDGGPRRHQETVRGRVHQGERPIRRRSWTQTPWHEGPRRPGRRVQRARRRRQMAASRLSSLKSARDASKAQLRRRDRWATLGGQARDQSRLRESNRSTQARGDAGTATRCTSWAVAQENGSECSPERRGAQQRSCHLVTGRRHHRRRCGRCVSQRELRGEPASGGAAARPGPAGPNKPGEAKRDGVLKRSQHRELSHMLTQLIATGHEAGGGRGAPKRKGQKMRCEPRAKETAGAMGRETPKLSPWGTRMVSLHGQSWRVRRAGGATSGREDKERRRRRTRGPQARRTGDSRRETRHGNKAPGGG